MRIDSTGTQEKLYQNAVRQDRSGAAQNQEEKGGQLKNHAVFAGDLNLIDDPVAKRREEARKEAMGLLKSQFQLDSDIDDSMERSRNHVDEVRKECDHASSEVARLEGEMDRLKEEYGYEDGSEELKSIKEEIGYWKKQMAEGERVIYGENASVRATKQALLERQYDMSDASDAAEDVMDAASGDIIGLLRKEALDKMEEDRKEEQEKAEEIKEKKEEKEELVEKDREQEHKEEATKNIVSGDEEIDKTELQQQIDEILEKQKLLEEDLKGLGVDLKA